MAEITDGPQTGEARMTGGLIGRDGQDSGRRRAAPAASPAPDFSAGGQQPSAGDRRGILRLFQGLPLEDKIRKSKLRIREWYEYWGGCVYVSFSGGKDSTVLLHLVRSMYPEVRAVFCDTGLEYPEVREFVAGCDNVTVIRPAMSFRDVLDRYGYPVVSKEQAHFIYQIRNTRSEYLRDCRLNGKPMPDGTRGRLGRIQERWKYLLDAPFKISDGCCDALKKRPFKRYEKETGLVPFTAVMASESRRRLSTYLVHGCNGFDRPIPKSTPIAFWTEQDVLRYIARYKIPCCPLYGEIAEAGDGALATTGAQRTGCMFCMFGLHLETAPNRFQKMERTHPGLHEYCIRRLGLGEVLEFMKIPWTCAGNTAQNSA